MCMPVWLIETEDRLKQPPILHLRSRLLRDETHHRSSVFSVSILRLLSFRSSICVGILTGYTETLHKKLNQISGTFVFSYSMYRERMVKSLHYTQHASWKQLSLLN
ncbi:hypothetical protein YC2023_049363 [Brassica napus]